MATIPPTNEGDELHVQTVTCPACGVPVAIGYPRCPKCKAAVPQAPRARRGSVREQLVAGGTSIEPPETGAGSANWLPWALLALLVIGAGAFFAMRSSSSSTKAPVADVEDDDEADDDPEAAADPDEPTTRGTGTAATPAGGDPMPAAVRALDDALRGERLWAKVSSDGTMLIVESSLCAQIQEQLGALAADARAEGATAVQCRAQHGELMFEQDL